MRAGWKESLFIPLRHASHRQLPLLACTAAVLALAACSRPPKVETALPQELQETASGGSRSPIEVDFYLDTTGSMQGFLHQPNGGRNYFDELLAGIGGMVETTWEKPELHYWGFGSAKPRIIDIRNFRNPAAYDGARTYIDQAIMDDPPRAAGQSRMPRLKIIVTDLYQMDNDMDKLAVDLSRVLNDPSLAVGILAIRNPFSGPIDDLPRGQKLPAGAAESLPLYLLVIGPAGDVTRCVRQLSTKLGLESLPRDQKIAMVFSRSTPPGLQRELTVKAISKPPGFVLYEDRIPKAKQLGIPYIADVRHDITAGLENKRGDADLEWAAAQSKIVSRPAVKAFRWDRGWVTSANDAMAVSPSLTVDGTSGSMSGTAKIARSRLRANSVYLFQIELDAEQTDFKDLQTWYVDLKDVPAIVESKSFPDKLGKTPNLRHLLETLSSKMFGPSRMPVARYYFYVESR